jgi:hypothetical protein
MKTTIFSETYNWLHVVVSQESIPFAIVSTGALRLMQPHIQLVVGALGYSGRGSTLTALLHITSRVCRHQDSKVSLATFTQTRVGHAAVWASTVHVFCAPRAKTVTRGEATTTEISPGCPLSLWAATAMNSYLCNRLRPLTFHNSYELVVGLYTQFMQSTEHT